MLIAHMFILKSTDMIIYAIMIEYANHIYISSCFLQKEATGDSSSQLEGGECREGRKGRDWNGAEEVFYFSLVLHLSEEKEEDGTEQKSFFPLVLHSLSMFSSLAEVIEVAIRAEYQVGVKCGDSQPNVSNVFQCCPSEPNSNVDQVNTIPRLPK